MRLEMKIEMRLETMPEYIEREVAMEVIANVSFYLNPLCLKEQRKKIKAIPTADVVEVVRCKDCKYHEEDETGVWCSRVFNSHKTVVDNFCKFGAKMDKE